MATGDIRRGVPLRRHAPPPKADGPCRCFFFVELQPFCFDFLHGQLCNIDYVDGELTDFDHMDE